MAAFKRVLDKGIDFDVFRYSSDEILGGLDIRGKVVLDIGCGSGYQALYWAVSKGPALVVGMDPARGIGSPSEVLDVFKRNLIMSGASNVSILRGDVAGVCFKENSVDVIVANNSAHHFIETARSIRKDPGVFGSYLEIFVRLLRILRPGGTIALSETMKYNLSQITGAFYENRINWPMHQMPKDWVHLLNKAGFEDVRCSYYTSYKLRRFRALSDNFLASYLTKSRYHVWGLKPSV